MDLSQLSVDPNNQTAELEVLHPISNAPITDEEGKKVIIILHGPDSKAQKDIIRKNKNEALSKAYKKKKMNMTAEQIESRGLELTIAATADWKHLAFEGEEPKCNPKNAREIYNKLPWLREQVEEFIRDRSNFLGE